MTTSATGQWQEKIAQAQSDLAALERQVEDGELVEADAAPLRAAYLQEVAEAEQAAGEPAEAAPADGHRNRRLLIGVLVAVVAVVGVTVAASQALVPRAPHPEMSICPRSVTRRWRR